MNEAQRQHEHYKDVRSRLWDSHDRERVAVQPVVRAPTKAERILEYRAKESARKEQEKQRARQAAEQYRARRRLEQEQFQSKPDWETIRAGIPKGTSMKRIAEYVLSHFVGVTFEDVKLSRRGNTHIMHARHCISVALWLERGNLCLVGHFMGRDHTTILNSLRKFGLKPERSSRS